MDELTQQTTDEFARYTAGRYARHKNTTKLFSGATFLIPFNTGAINLSPLKLKQTPTASLLITFNYTPILETLCSAEL